MLLSLHPGMRERGFVCVCVRLFEVRGRVYKIRRIKRVAWRDECLLALQTGLLPFFPPAESETKVRLFFPPA